MCPLNKNEVELVVRDDGIGMPKEVDFRSLDSLGLHLVTILVEDQLQGTIKLDRKRGTIFHIRFGRKR
jgi:two-component sensor histidine kinase